MPEREAHALTICQRGVDLHEQYERVTIRNGKSMLPHATWSKVVRDILEVGDVWAFSTSSLELHNPKAKRVAQSGGARHLTYGKDRTVVVQPRGGGPSRVVERKGYSTTMARSTLQKLLGQKALQTGYNIEDLCIHGIESRRRERVFGESGSGRSKWLSEGVKVEQLHGDYDPCGDTCLAAFVRLMAAQASA